jgi:hypothetical protein
MENVYIMENAYILELLKTTMTAAGENVRISIEALNGREIIISGNSFATLRPMSLQIIIETIAKPIISEACYFDGHMLRVSLEDYIPTCLEKAANNIRLKRDSSKSTSKRDV